MADSPPEIPTPETIDQTLLAALDDEIAEEEDPRRLALLQVERGYALIGVDPPRATEAFSEALRLDPRSPAAMSAMQRRLRASQQWEPLLDLYDAQLQAERDRRCRAEILLEKGWLLQDLLGRPEEAKRCLWLAYEAEPEGWLAPLLSLERLAATEGDHDTLAKVYQAVAQTADDPDRQAVALRALARVQARLGAADPAQQAELLRRAADLSLDRASTLVQLEIVAERHGLHQQRVDALEALAQEIGEASQSIAYLVEAAWIARHEGDDPRRARSLLEAAMRLRPDEALVRDELISLAQQQGDTGLLVELLEQQLGSPKTAQSQADLSFRVALARLELGQGDAAATAIEGCLTACPGYLPALMELERAALAAADYTRLVDVWVAMAASYQSELEARHVGPRVQALWQAAWLTHVRLADPDRAAALCQQALDLDPEFEPAETLLEEILERARRFEDLAVLLERRLARSEGAESTRLLQRLANLCTGPLSDPRRSADTLTRLLAVNPSDVRVARRLVDALARLDDHAGLERALAALENLEISDHLRSECLLLRADLLESQLDDPDAALALHRQVLDRQPANTHALIGAERLLGARSDWISLAQLFELAAAHAGSQTQRGILLLRAAQLHADALDQGDAAADLYQRATSNASTAFYAAGKLVAPNLPSDHEQRAAALEAAQAAAPTPVLARSFCIALGQIYESKPAHRPRVIELVSKAAEGATPGSPSWAVALHMLADTHVANQQWDEALRAMTRLGEHAPTEIEPYLLHERAWLAGMAGDAAAARGLWQQLHERHPSSPTAAWALLWDAARAGDPVEQARVCAEISRRTVDEALAATLRLREATLVQSARGAQQIDIDALWDIVANAPHNLEAVLGILAHPDTSAGQRAEILTGLTSQVQEKHHGQLALLLAHVHEAAGQPAPAMTQLRHILDVDANHLPSLLIVQRLAAAAGLRDTEARVWMRIAALLHDEDGRAMAYRRAGSLFDVLSQPDSAAVAYRQALAITPRDPEIVGRLGEAYRDAQDHGNLEQLLSTEIAWCEDAQRRVALLFERSELRAEQLDNPHGAACDLLRILDLDANNRTALGTLAELFQRYGDSERAASCYQRLIENTSDPQVQRPAVAQLADLLTQQQKPLEAAALWEQYAQTAPGDAEALEQLAQIYVDQDDSPRAARVYEQLAALPAGGQDRVHRLRQLARFRWQRLGDPSAAQTILLQALDSDHSSLPLLGDLRQLCSQSGTTDQLRQPIARAKAAVRESIGVNPLNVQKYDDLLRLAEWSQDRHTAIASLGVLCCLDAATEQAQQLYRRRMDTIAFAPKGQLSAHSWRGTLMPRETRGAISDVWRLVAEAVPKLHADALRRDLSLLSASREDRTLRHAASLVNQVASLLNVDDFVLHVSSDAADTVRPVVSDTAALVVSSDVAVARGAGQRFRLGRALALLHDRTASLEALTLDQIQILIGGAINLVNPEVVVGGAAAEVREYAKALQRVLSRKARRALPLAVNQLLQEGADLDIDGWRRGALLTADKAALLACGDIVVAMQQTVPELRRVARGSREASAELLANHPVARHLLPFSVSRQCVMLRRELRL